MVTMSPRNSGFVLVSGSYSTTNLTPITSIVVRFCVALR